MTSPDAIMWLSSTEADHVVALVSSDGDCVSMAMQTVKDHPGIANIEVGDTPGSAYAPEIGTAQDNTLSYHRYNITLQQGADEDAFLSKLAGDLQAFFERKNIDCAVSVRR